MGNYKTIGIGVCLLLVLSIVSCNQPPTFHQSGAHSEVAIHRGPQGQLSLRVEDPAGQDPDLVLFESLGYSHAGDRLFQMDILRRQPTARLAALLGKEALDSDIETTAIGLPTAVEASERNYRGNTRVFPLLEAYANGVNRYIDELPQKNASLSDYYGRITGKKGYRPEAWQPRDSMAISVFLSYLLSSNLDDKLLASGIWAYQALFTFQGSKKIRSLMDTRALSKTSILTPKKNLKPLAKKLESPYAGKLPLFFAGCRKGRSWMALGSQGGCSGLATPGSNSGVFSRDFTGTGKVLLANDPHLMLTFPATFMEIAMDSVKTGGTFHAAGLSFPGVPGILIGYNTNLAWVFTNHKADVLDLYWETIKDGHVVHKNKKVKVESRPAEIWVRQLDGSLAKAEGIPPFRTVPHHGPILSDHYGLVKDYSEGLKLDISMKWLGHTGTNEISAMIAMNRARNVREFKAALDLWKVGSQNISYGAVDGTIGYRAVGHFPVREYRKSASAPPPYLILRDKTGQLEWKEGARLPNPAVENPASGKIVTANNSPYGRNFEALNHPDNLSFNYHPGFRAERINQRVDKAKGHLTIEAMRSIQFDHLDLLGKKVVEGLLTPIRSELKKLSPSGKELLARLENWDYVVTRDKKEPSHFYLFLMDLSRRYFSKHYFARDFKKTRLKLLEAFVKSAFAVPSLIHHLEADLAKTAKPKARKAALKEIQESLNHTADLIQVEDLEDRRWGELHPLSFFNLLDGALPSLLTYPIERDGSFTTVDMGAFRVDWFLDLAFKKINRTSATSLGNFWGPAFRLIMAIHKDGTIEAYNSLAGASHGRFDKITKRELRRWGQGEQRPLVSFIEDHTELNIPDFSD